MTIPQTYRTRLLVYSSLLVAFLVGVLFFFYSQSRDAILDTAEKNIGLFVRQIEGKIKLEEHELQKSARVISSNIHLQEYLFIVVSIGTDPLPLQEIFQRQFGWLSLSRAVIISDKGRPVLGENYSEFIQALRSRNESNGPMNQLFYYSEGSNLEMIAVTPVHYRGQFLGNLALSYAIDEDLLEAALQIGYGHVFIVQDGKIISSTLDESWNNEAFVPGGGELELGGQTYLVRQVVLSDDSAAIPNIWFGFSSPELMDQLNRNRMLMVALASGGSIAILIVGFLLFRNFSIPLGKLVHMIQAVGEGRFPEIKRTNANDEIGYLTNQFSAMVSSLREKQHEIDEAHSQLEEQAATDALTSLYNRRHLYELYPKLWSEAERQNKKLTVILADLDKFKQINDQYGHPAGDQVLVSFSHILRDCCRVSDFVFRMGGEEFLVLTTGGIEGGEILAEKIRSLVEKTPMRYENMLIPITASFGVAQAEHADGREGLKAVLTRADRALYAAKRAGRNRVATLDMRQMSA